MNSKIFDRRKRLLIGKLNKERIKAFLVTDLKNIRYLTGFHCSFGYLLIVGGRLYFLTDTRYTNEARRKAAVDELVEAGGDSVPRRIAEIAGDHGASQIAFEPHAVTVGHFDVLRSKNRRIRWLPESNLVENLRAIKDESEISSIRKSSRIMDRAFRRLAASMKPGMTESEIRSELESLMIRERIEGISFETIVASGPRGAYAHGKPSGRRIRAGDFVVLDFGVCVDGYHSDMTRTVFAGRPAAEDRRLYNAVLDAQRMAIEKACAGALACTPDSAARESLEASGLRRFFTHGLGHGVGLDVHESPRLAPGSRDRLKSNMVFTIEPGIYIDGKCGIRIEDTFVLTADYPIPLTKSAHSLIII